VVARRHAAALLILLGTLLVAIGLPLRQVHRATRPAAFADHAEDVLRRPVVREALADSAVSAITREVRRLAPAAAPTVRAAVAPRAAAVVDSDGFRRAWRETARVGLKRTLDDRRRTIAFTVADVAGITASATGPLPAPVTTVLQRAGDVRIFGFDRSRTAAVRTERAERLSGLGRPFLLAATASLFLALLVSPARGPTALRCGLGVLGASLLVLAVELAARTFALSGLSGRDHDVAAAVWDELLGGLRTDALVLMVAGLAVALVAGVAGGRGAGRRPARPVG
jgi:hypothetical protein